MTEQLAVIHWHSEKSGKSGHGEPVPIENAQVWCQVMNKKNPQIHHWYERIEDHEETQTQTPVQD